MLHASGVHFIVTVTVTVIIKSVVVGFISFVACEAISSNSIPFCNACFATRPENRCGRNASRGGDGVFSLYAGFCVIDVFRFAGFIRSS